jgi:integrase
MGGGPWVPSRNRSGSRVNLKEQQELLGHRSLARTMRYAHLAPEHLRTAVSRLEGLTRNTTEDRRKLGHMKW